MKNLIFILCPMHNEIPYISITIIDHLLKVNIEATMSNKIPSNEHLFELFTTMLNSLRG